MVDTMAHSVEGVQVRQLYGGLKHDSCAEQIASALAAFITFRARYLVLLLTAQKYHSRCCEVVQVREQLATWISHLTWPSAGDAGICHAPIPQAMRIEPKTE